MKTDRITIRIQLTVNELYDIVNLCIKNQTFKADTESQHTIEFSCFPPDCRVDNVLLNTVVPIFTDHDVIVGGISLDHLRVKMKGGAE